MSDIFIEQLVKRKNTVLTLLQEIVVVLAAAALSLLFFMTPAIKTLFPFIFTICCWGVFIFIRNQHVEYEYSFTNGELDIDKILGKRKRRRYVSGEAKSFDLFTPFSVSYENELSRQGAGEGRILDATSSAKSENRWLARFRGADGVLTTLIFEPKPELVEAIDRYVPAHNRGQRS